MNWLRIQTYIFIILGITSALLWVNFFYRDPVEAVAVSSEGNSAVSEGSSSPTEKPNLAPDTPVAKVVDTVTKPDLLVPQTPVAVDPPTKAEPTNTVASTSGVADAPVRKQSSKQGSLTIRNNMKSSIDYKVVSLRTKSIVKTGSVKPLNHMKIMIPVGIYSITASDSQSKRPVYNEVKEVDSTGTVVHVK